MSIRNRIKAISRTGFVYATVVAITNNLVTVKIDGGPLLTNIPYYGGPLEVRQRVEVHWLSNGSPSISYSSSPTSEKQIRQIVQDNIPADTSRKGGEDWHAPSDAAILFTELQDVPNSYSGNHMRYVRVNASETELEFVSDGAGRDIVIWVSESETYNYAADATGYADAITKLNDLGNTYKVMYLPSINLSASPDQFLGTGIPDNTVITSVRGNLITVVPGNMHLGSNVVLNGFTLSTGGSYGGVGFESTDECRGITLNGSGYTFNGIRIIVVNEHPSVDTPLYGIYSNYHGSFEVLGSAIHLTSFNSGSAGITEHVGVYFDPVTGYASYGTMKNSYIGADIATNLAGHLSTYSVQTAGDISNLTSVLPGDLLPWYADTSGSSVAAHHHHAEDVYSDTPTGKYLKDDGTYDTPCSLSLLDSIEFTSGSNSYTFSSIDQSFWKLRLEWIARSNNPANLDYLLFRINGDSNNANYRNVGYVVWGTSQTVESYEDRTFAHISSGSAPANSFGSGYCEINGYSKNGITKVVLSTFGYRYDTSSYQQVGGQLSLEWEGTNPITSIVIETTSGANFASGSTFRLYGVG